MRYVLQNGVSTNGDKGQKGCHSLPTSLCDACASSPTSMRYVFPSSSAEQKCSQLQQYHQASRARVVVKSPGTTRRVARIHLALALPSSFSSLPLITSRHPSSSPASPASIRFSPLPHFWMPIDQCAKLAGGRRAGSRLPRESRRGQTHAFAMCGKLPLH